MRAEQCGGCGLRVRFWPLDGAKLTCPNCGLNHEIECDEMLDLNSGERTAVVMLVVAVEKERDWEHDASAN